MRNGITAILIALLLGACAAPRPVTYGPAPGPNAGGGCGACGEVVAVDRVQVQAQGTGGGALLGALIGGALGYQVGDGSGQKLATGAGLVAGAVVGNEIEKSNQGGEWAYQISMRLDDGRRATVVQREYPRVRPGDRAFIENDRVYRIRQD